MDRLKQIVEKEFESKKMRIFAKVGEEIESLKRSVLTKIESYMKDENQTSIETNMKLEFRNGISRTILTGEDIKGEEGVPIEVALVDYLAGDVVDDEPEASVNVEIVLLKARSNASDWTADEFNMNIVSEVEGKQPILAGNITLQLQRGVGIVEKIKIRNHASVIKPPQFMLGARVVGASHIKEAKTEPFILKNYRVKYYKKHKNPSLLDEVSRLVHIRRGGNIEKRLQHNKIYRVEDFLIQLLINPEGLKSIVTSQSKKWKAIVNNAQACLSSERMYCYIDPKQERGVVFSILGHVLGLLCSGSYYSQTSTLQSEKHKADAEKLLKSACRNWREVKAFDDQDSLLQHLADSCEMVGESSSRRWCPSTNMFGETDFGSLATFSDQDIDVMYDALMQCNNAWPCSPSLVGSLMMESNGDEERAGDEPQIVDRRNPWKKLLCVSRWFSVRRRVALGVGDNRKKQKVG